MRAGIAWVTDPSTARHRCQNRGKDSALLRGPSWRMFQKACMRCVVAIMPALHACGSLYICAAELLISSLPLASVTVAARMAKPPSLHACKKQKQSMRPATIRGCLGPPLHSLVSPSGGQMHPARPQTSV